MSASYRNPKLTIIFVYKKMQRESIVKSRPKAKLKEDGSSPVRQFIKKPGKKKENEADLNESFFILGYELQRSEN